jgi:hypothetical protein
MCASALATLNSNSQRRMGMKKMTAKKPTVKKMGGGMAAKKKPMAKKMGGMGRKSAKY